MRYFMVMPSSRLILVGLSMAWVARVLCLGVVKKAG